HALYVCALYLVALSLGHFISVDSHAGFQRANTFAQPLSELRQLLRTEDEYSDQEDHQQMHWLEQTFKHSSLRRAATGTHIAQVTGAKHSPSTCLSNAPTCYFPALAVTYLLLEHLGRERSRARTAVTF